MNTDDYLERVYANSVFLDFEKLYNDYEQQLIEYGDYLPPYLIRYINHSYFTNLSEKKAEKVYNKLYKNKYNSETDKIKELIKWVKSHNEYNDLILWETVDKINEFEEFLKGIDEEMKSMDKGEKWIKKE